MFISQPALTKQLLSLEEQVNCKLLKRTHTGVELTTAGQYFYQQALQILDLMQETADHLRRTAPKQRWQIGAIPSIANFFLPAILQKQRKQLPAEIVVKDITQTLARAVIKNKLTCAVVQDFYLYPVDTTLQSFQLFTEPYYAVYPHGHPLDQLDSLHLQDFTQYPIVMWNDPSDLRQSIRNFSEQLTHPVTFIDLHWDDSLLEAVMEGAGISFIPELVTKHVDQTQLKIQKLGPRAFHRKIDVIYLAEHEQVVKQLFAPANWYDTVPVMPYASF